MAVIPYDYQEKIKYHLGYSSYSGVPAADTQDLEASMNDVSSETQIDYILSIIDTLDNIMRYRDPTNANSYTALQTFAGDINRTRKEQLPRDTLKSWEQVYLHYTDILAKDLWVVNYRRDENNRYRWVKGAVMYVNAVPGHAVPNVGSNIYLTARMA